MANNILLVNRCPVLLMGLRDLLASESDFCVCGEATGWDDALRLTKTLQPEIAMLDLATRKGSRFGLIERLCAESPSIKILVFSGYEDSMFAERCLRAGALGYVRSDQPVPLLLTAIRRVGAGRIHLSEEVLEHTLKGVAPRCTNGSGRVESLSNRELDVFALIGEGLGAAAIAGRLNLSVKTVDSHRENIKRKLGLSSSKEVICRAIHWALTADGLTT